MRQFILLGLQTSNSLSSVIHQQFAAQFGIKINYQAIDVAPEKLLQTIHKFMGIGGCGINITAPYKEIVFAHLQHYSAKALQAKSVNTVVIKPDGTLWGDNTDGVGLIADFKRNKIPITAQRILIFGAGGAVRGILPALLALQPQSIILINRDLNKANQVAADFKHLGNITVRSYAEIATLHSDIVVNATSNVEIFNTFNFNSGFLYDLNYKQKILAAGVVNGLGMLVEQAAVAFELWHGEKPDTQVVIQALRRF